MARRFNSSDAKRPGRVTAAGHPGDRFALAAVPEMLGRKPRDAKRISGLISYPDN